MYDKEEAVTCLYRYTVTYDSKVYFGDKDGYHDLDFNTWTEAISEYETLVRWGCDAWLVDNEYGVTFHLGEWD